jgi:DNA helicase-2/ATP-dependent DNA helicase PcrA
MQFHADLHVHSKYSRATSRDLDLEHLAWWAARKGISVVGTGDCVHPAWLAELKDKLAPAGNGLYALKPEIDTEVRKTLPPSCQTQGGPLVRFMLSVEISTIYKKTDRTRKIHHLIYVPDFDAADRLAASLGRIGNIASDGRPILGLDSRNLLEIALQSSPDSYLVPAHIWTPWFAALGSQSGFDSIRDCYGDLSDHIFAVETGLSSDPAMNWRVSFLDRYRLTSNSDAHSPGKLGREATRFSCEPGFLSIRRALETGDGYDGTVEFFPEEGKYHMDGHRGCGVRLDPAETIANEGRCPVCGNRVTLGVAHRVDMLADRKEQDAAPPATAGSVTSLVPLPEILSEIVGGGVASQGVARAYDRTSAALGPDYTVLQEAPVEDVAKVNPLLGEAVTRLRAGSVIRQAGYDGEYGVIRLFEDGELDRLTRGALLFDDAPASKRTRTKKKAAAPVPETEAPSPAPAPMPAPSDRTGVLAALDADQARAAEAVDGPLIVIAGPGSGKTRMLTHRLAHLVLERRVPAAACLAVTFTRRATEEMQDRLAILLPSGAGTCAVHSFHSLGLAILRESYAAAGLKPDFRIADEPERRTALAAALGVTESKAARLLKAVSLLKRTGQTPDDADTAAAMAACRDIGTAQNWVDFDDLVALPAALLEDDAEAAELWRGRFSHLCVDEFQDVDEQQYRLLRCLTPPAGNVCVIGDPNQAIYGFRGADAACFTRFQQDFPSARTVRLGRNYRSTGTIVTAATQVINKGAINNGLIGRGGLAAADDDITRPMLEPVTLFEAATERVEAEFVAATIESLMGGHDMLTANREQSKEQAGKTTRPLGFADFAVLCRTGAQSAALREAFDRAGIPFKKSSPAPIAGQGFVRSLLAALDRQGADMQDAGLPARIAAAAEQIRRDGDADIAALTEAKRWLSALAETGARRRRESSHRGAAAAELATTAALAVTGDVAALRELAALATEADFWDARADRVSLLTMHAAKGLEFPVVFVAGLEDGLVPFSWGAPSGGAPEIAAEAEDALDGDGRTGRAPDAEERRLFYVAMTRAKDRLFLSRALQRTWRGALRTLPPSPFLRDIAAELVVRHAAPVRKEKREAMQYSLF